MGTVVPDPEFRDESQDTRRAYYRDVVDLRRQLEARGLEVGALAARLLALEGERPTWDYQGFARDCIVSHLASFGGKQIKYFHQWIPMAWAEFQKACRSGPDGSEPMTVAEIVGLQT